MLVIIKCSVPIDLRVKWHNRKKLVIIFVAHTGHNTNSNTPKNTNEKEKQTMASNNNSSNQMVVPEARAAMDRFKMEAAAELGVLSTTKYTRHLNW